MSPKTYKIPITIWLFLLTAMILSIIIIGGLTRLTDSGLSMVEWKPIMGFIPPLNNKSWILAFAKYKLSPEFKIINFSMTLNEFKYIFWWEWSHRFIARILGFIFFFPFLFFLIKKAINKKLLIILIITLLLGIIQALVGWWMVKSGLVDIPHVSAYRLAFHLSIALIIFCILFWISISMIYGKMKKENTSKPIKNIFHLALILIFITIISGAFMAGSDAGKSFNTYPLMGGKLFPDDYLLSNYGVLNIFENITAINFNHRWLASLTFLLIVIQIIYLLFYYKKEINKISLYLVLIFISLQFLLGILTLINHVPIILASLHQTNSILLLASSLFAYHRFVYK